MRDVRVGLADPLHALDRRVGVLHRGLPAHVPRPAVRLATASRANWCGSSACLIYLLLMAEAFFGYLLPWGNMSYWGAQVIVSCSARSRSSARPGRVDSRRLLHLRHHAEPLLRVARGRAAAGADVPGGRAHHGAARGGLEQSRRHRDQEAQGPATGIRSTASRSIRTTRSRTWSASSCSCRCSAASCSSRPTWAAISSSTRTSSPANPLQTPRAHRAGVVLHAVLRDAARGAVDHGTQFWGVMVMGAAVVIFFFLPWLDRSQGEVDPLSRLDLQVGSWSRFRDQLP